jgi:hypothetical protein
MNNSERTVTPIGIAAIAGGCSTVAAILAVGLWAGAYGSTVDNHSDRLDGHQLRLDRHYEMLAEVREDIREIKTHLRYLRGRAMSQPDIGG